MNISLSLLDSLSRIAPWWTFGSSTPRTARTCPERKVLPFPFPSPPPSLFVHQLLHRTWGFRITACLRCFLKFVLYIIPYLFGCVIPLLKLGFELGLVIEGLRTFVPGIALLL